MSINASALTLKDMITYYLYGTATVPQSYEDRLRPDITAATYPATSLNINAVDYMTNGAGRYANLSQVPLIQLLFGDPQGSADLQSAFLSPGQTKITVGALLSQGLDLINIETTISQYQMDTASSDYVYRGYVWSTGKFRLNNDAEIDFTDPAHPTITNVTLRPYNDDFDYISSNSIIQISNGSSMETVDPYAIGRTVALNFSETDKDALTKIAYNETSYSQDVIRWGNQYNGNVIDGYLTVFHDGNEQIENSGVLDYTLPDGGSVIYGSDADNVINGTTGYSNALNVVPIATGVTAWVSVDSNPELASHTAIPGDKNTIVISGGGNDTITTGSGDDIIFAGGDADTIISGDGYDRIDGGAGNDILIGALANGFNAEDLQNPNYFTTFHEDWTDWKRDILSGGEGYDIYLSGGAAIGLNPNSFPEGKQTFAEALDTTDIFDGSDESFIIHGQTEVMGTELINWTLTDVTLAAAIDTFDAETGTYYFEDAAVRTFYNGPDPFTESLVGYLVDDVNYGSLITLTLPVGYFAATLGFVSNIAPARDPNSTTPWTIFGSGTLETESDLASADTASIAGADISHNDEIIAGNGDDTVFGLSGDDTIVAAAHGGGDDLIYGGTGNDTVDYSDAVNDLEIALYVETDESGTASGNDIATDHLFDVENVLGGAGNDSIRGSDVANILIGGSGNDVLFGGVGNDALDGGVGIDRVDYDGLASDYSFARNADGSVTVASDLYGNDTLTNVEVIWFGGDDSYHDLIDLAPELVQTASIQSVSGQDELVGTSDDDVISSLGNDYLNFGEGNGIPSTAAGGSDTSLNERSADIIQFPLSTTSSAYGDLASVDIESQSQTASIGEPLPSADIISLEDFVHAMQADDHAGDLWFEPEPIGSVI